MQFAVAGLAALAVASAWVMVHTSAWAFERLAPHGRPILAGVQNAPISCC